MNVNEMTFGVEIETVAGQQAIAAGLAIGQYHHGVQVPYLPQGWKAEKDGSIAAGGDYACEIVSPVLKGEEGLAQVVAVIAELKAKGHRVNVSCGIHVHVGWARTNDAASLARLITLVAGCEKGLYAITGTKSRERGIYCGGVQKYGNDKTAKIAMDSNRYHALNLTCLAYGIRETVEFRVFSGSLNPVKVIGWIQVCLGLVQRALTSKRLSQWVPAPLTSNKVAGEGAKETERLLAFLDWGSVYHTAGDKKYGLIPSSVSLTEIKKAFRKLAKQYDLMA